LTAFLKLIGLVWLLFAASCGGSTGGGSPCAEGQACGSGGTCQAGICKRTVTGTAQTTFWTDDDTKTTAPVVPGTDTNSSAGTPSALLIRDSSPIGYAKFPFTVDANQGFSVAGVPSGAYFVEFDRTEFFNAACGAGTQLIPVTASTFYELSGNVPDLGGVSATRRDLVRAFVRAQVALGVSGMDPWASGDEIRTASSQTRGTQRVFLSSQPAAGATDLSVTFDWLGFGLLDASKNDVVFVYQRAISNVASGGATASVLRATKYARLTGVTLADGNTTPVAAALVAAPQTGTFHANLAAAQFAALAADVNPGATHTVTGLSVAAAPHSITYPDRPPGELTTMLLLTPTNPIDADFGSLTYGQFLDPFWKEFVRVVANFDVPSEQTSTFVLSDYAATGLPVGPIGPVLSPPKSPRVNGLDAFVRQTGVGVQPTISWSAPALGSPTSYFVDIRADALPCADGQSAGVSALIRNGTSFRVPPGFLQTGIGYHATITARQAPWDTADAGPFRSGTPVHTAAAVTATFVP
jgi:hypothetical protein